MNITYTIIIPHKNIPNLLKRCIDSIPQREDVQVIVVDDNSDPNIVDFAHFPGLERADVECYFTKEGKGAGYARNVGLKHARGKWLLFADADDFLHKGALLILDLWKDSEYDIIFFNSNRIDSVTGDDKGNMISELVTEEMLRYKFPVPWGKMIRRELIVTHRIFFDEVLASEDEMFSLKCGYHAQKTKVSQDFLCCNMMRNNSISWCKSFDFLLEKMLVYITVNKFILEHKIDNNMQRPCFDLVLSIKHLYGQQSYLKALIAYLQNAPLQTMRRDFKHLIKFWLHRTYKRTV